MKAGVASQSNCIFYLPLGHRRPFGLNVHCAVHATEARPPSILRGSAWQDSARQVNSYAVTKRPNCASISEKETLCRRGPWRMRPEPCCAPRTWQAFCRHSMAHALHLGKHPLAPLTSGGSTTQRKRRRPAKEATQQNCKYATPNFGAQEGRRTPVQSV